MKRIAMAVVCGAVFFGVTGIAEAQNFQCWRVRNRPKFTRVTATVVDSFAGTNATQIRRPLLLCDQAGVNGNGTAGPGRQSCFKVRGAKLAANITHSVTDMFGTRNEIKRRKALAVCVPATSTP